MPFLSAKQGKSAKRGKKILQNGKNLYSNRHVAGVAQLVEHELPKLGVAGSIPVARSINPLLFALLDICQR